eukprot:SAG31_NODE_27102_length_431_cov_0.987952_1_plen_93_part_10
MATTTTTITHPDGTKISVTTVTVAAAKQLEIELPKIFFGSAGFGNLYSISPYEQKKAVIKAIVESAGDGIAVIDSAGKYGAGMALEVIGQALE